MLIQMCPIWQNLQWIRRCVNGFLVQTVYTFQRHSMAAGDSQYQKVPNNEICQGLIENPAECDGRMRLNLQDLMLNDSKFYGQIRLT